MIHLIWRKLSENKKRKIRQVKPITFIPGSIKIDKEKFEKIIEKEIEKSLVIVGILQDRWIPGLENSRQFETQTIKDISKSLKKFENLAQIFTLEYPFIHTKYLIKELLPTKIIWFNGSWSRNLNYREEYWKAIDIGAKIINESPFNSDKTARDFAERISKSNQEDLERKWSERPRNSKLSHREILNFAADVSKLSWDWEGQTGAVIANAGRISAFSHNKVLPYESAMLDKGSLRQKARAPIGEQLEYYSTNHAECSAILRAQENAITLKNCDLYTTKFPCPFCARIIADTEIETIFYSGDYTNNLGYKTLEECGKRLVKICL